MLRVMLGALWDGDWRWVLHPNGPRRELVGDEDTTRLGSTARIVAQSMYWRARGYPGKAWEQLDNAGRALSGDPRDRSRPGTSPGGALMLPPGIGTRDTSLHQQVEWLIHRERADAADLWRRSLPIGTEPVDHLTFAVAELLDWKDLDPFASLRPGMVESAPADRSWSALRERANRLRQFADPTAESVGEGVWRKAGGYDSLLALAFLRIAEWPQPAPWLGSPATAQLPVRLGRRAMWEHARWVSVHGGPKH